MNLASTLLAFIIAIASVQDMEQPVDPSQSANIESRAQVVREIDRFSDEGTVQGGVIDRVVDWGRANQRLLFWLGLGSALTFVISLLSLPWLVALIPDDYFVPKKRHPAPWKNQRPAVRLLALILKNLLGLVLLAGGILMLIVPGQGILTMVAGLLLLDYPGKFRLERKLVTIPAILNGLNWLRGKANKPPLIV